MTYTTPRPSRRRVEESVDRHLTALATLASDLYREQPAGMATVLRLIGGAYDVLWPHRSVAGGFQPSYSRDLRSALSKLGAAHSLLTGRSQMRSV